MFSLPPLLMPPVAFKLPCCALSTASPTDSTAPATLISCCALIPTVVPLAILPAVATVTSFCAFAVTAPAAATEPLTVRLPGPLAVFVPFAFNVTVLADSTLLTPMFPAAVT
ncbi:hypothetical protein R69608_07929 [Paraburkholderia nemoris]|nr:hypothetical protein R69608_07929 [Paraburkholderia nemoris]